jgi:hypothetical protein
MTLQHAWMAVCIGWMLSMAPALAHDDHALDAMNAPHGGQLRAAGAYHFELVVAAPGTVGEGVTVHVTDHAGKPLPTQGAKGSVLLQSGKERWRFELTPQGTNALQARGRYTAGTDLKAVVYITMPGQSGVQARFVPFASTKAPAKPGHKH